jgi:sugar phosphate isomerase/epimerase
MTDLTRREWLGVAAGAVAGGVASPDLLVPAAHAAASRMRFGLVTYLWGQDWDVPTLIANCTTAGLGGVELRTQHAHGVEPSISRAERVEVRKRFEDSPVTLVGLGTNEEFDDPDPDVVKARIETTKAYLQLSADVGGSGVKVKPNDFHEGVPHDQTIEQIGKSLNLVGAFGADIGQAIRLEVHGRCSELPTIKAIMDVADHPNVGVCWNSNDADLEGGGLEYNFNLVKDRLGATTHVRELNIGAYPYTDLIRLLAGIDYDGWVLLEARTRPNDRVAALAEQRHVFEQMVAAAG